MFGLVLVTFLSIVIAWFFIREDGIIATIAGIMFFIIFFFPFVSLTGGLVPDYSVGTRDGYVTKISRKGLIWKTNEGELQVGTGNMAALQEPFEFSIINSTLLPQLEVAASEALRVRLSYTQYVVPDWKKAESEYVVLNVEVLDEKDK